MPTQSLPETVTDHLPNPPRPIRNSVTASRCCKTRFFTPSLTKQHSQHDPLAGLFAHLRLLSTLSLCLVSLALVLLYVFLARSSFLLFSFLSSSSSSNPWNNHFESFLSSPSSDFSVLFFSTLLLDSFLSYYLHSFAVYSLSFPLSFFSLIIASSSTCSLTDIRLSTRIFISTGSIAPTQFIPFLFL